MGCDAHWDATDQVPRRAIASGAIDRFDAIDDSDGGETSPTAPRANGTSTATAAACAPRPT